MVEAMCKEQGCMQLYVGMARDFRILCLTFVDNIVSLFSNI